MYLSKVAIINYKSCQNLLIDIQKDSPNTFIGMNDAGKSAILKAIGLLLEAKSNFMIPTDSRSTSDISNTPLNYESCDSIYEAFMVPKFASTVGGCVIIGEFKIEETDFTSEFQENASSHLKWAIESSPDNTVTLLRHFAPNDSTGKYFLCTGDSSQYSSLWNKKATELQAIRRTLSLSETEIANENNQGRFSSIEIVRAIYKKTGYERVWAESPTFIKNDLPFLPVYRYIDWNTSLNDIENLANDVLKSKVDSSKAILTSQAIKLSRQATEEVNKEFEALTRELTQDLKSIKGIKAQVNFSVSEKISDLIINKNTADGDIRLDSQGEGVKRQILFAFLKWGSTRGLDIEDSRKKFIWCFDEPESHLYPAAQRELYNIISDLAKSNYQVFIGTHSTIFIDRSSLKDIYRVELNEGYSTLSKCNSIEDVHSVLGIKNSDILFYNKFLAVEGESEDILIPHFYKLYTGHSFEENAIKLISLGGIGEYRRNKETLERILEDFGKSDSTIHYILDNDTNETGNNVYLLGVCDLEDLMSNELWIRLVEEQCGISLTNEQLNEIRGQLESTVSARKFHKLLGALVAGNETRTEFLPSKVRCANLLKSYIVSTEQIPEVILQIFDGLVE